MSTLPGAPRAIERRILPMALCNFSSLEVFMFKPSAEKAALTREMVAAALANALQEPQKYTLAYAYYVQSGLFSKKMSSYAIAFSVEKAELVVASLDAEGNALGNAVQISKQDLLSAKFGLQGDVRIKSDQLNEDLRLIVPGYTPPALEAAYVLPADQTAEAEAFREFIKSW
jgi:hypothetical protein